MKREGESNTTWGSLWLTTEWPLVLLVFGISFCLGYLGFGRYLDATGLGGMFLDRIYRTIQLYILQVDLETSRITWELDCARFLAPAVAFYAAAKAIAIVFRSELSLFRSHLFRGHVVICGLGRKGLLLARAFNRRGVRVIVVEKDEENDFVKQCIDEGIPVLIGDAANYDVLKKARVHKAAHVIAVSGKDGTNAEIAVHARALRGDRGTQMLSCHVDVFDAELCGLLREREVAAEKPGNFRLEYFNVFEIAARVLLQEHPAFDATSRVGNLKPRVLIVGLGRLGESLLVEMARMWWHMHRRDRSRLRVVVVDRAAHSKKRSLCLNYPRLEEACDFTVLQMDVLGPDFQSGEFLFDRRGKCILTSAYVCVDDDSVALTAGLALNRNLRGSSVPIVIRMLRDAGLAMLLQTDKSGRGEWSNPYSFGLLDRACRPDEILRGTNEVLARAIHNEYLRHQASLGRTPMTNPSMCDWDDLSDAMKESNRRQADHIGEKLRCIGCILVRLVDWNSPLCEFSNDEIEIMSEMEHERWIQERRDTGWGFTEGPKDIQAKVNPALVPWRELSEELRDIDRNAVHHLPAFLSEAGFGIKRLRQRPE
jgi:hypothetical protein